MRLRFHVPFRFPFRSPIAFRGLDEAQVPQSRWVALSRLWTTITDYQRRARKDPATYRGFVGRLQQLHALVRAGQMEQAAAFAYRLDTIERDLIPDALWDEFETIRYAKRGIRWRPWPQALEPLRGLDDASGSAAACAEPDAADWHTRAKQAAEEARRAIGSKNPALMLSAARGLHFLAGEVSASCHLQRAILGDRALKSWYPTIYLLQDRITEAMHMQARAHGHFAGDGLAGLGSTGEACEFREIRPGRWFYFLGKSQWGEWYNVWGPFSTFEAAKSHLFANNANPGGYNKYDWKRVREFWGKNPEDPPNAQDPYARPRGPTWRL